MVVVADLLSHLSEWKKKTCSAMITSCAPASSSTVDVSWRCFTQTNTQARRDNISFLKIEKEEDSSQETSTVEIHSIR